MTTRNGDDIVDSFPCKGLPVDGLILTGVLLLLLVAFHACLLGGVLERLAFSQSLVAFLGIAVFLSINNNRTASTVLLWTVS